MKNIILLINISFLFSSSALTQHKITLRNNAGIANGSSVIDGYYFSIDVGIPLIKSLEIAPTFSFATMRPNSWPAFS